MLLLALFVLAGCGQLHPKVEELSFSEGDNKPKPPLFPISTTDFSEKLLEKGLISSIEDKENAWIHYVGMDERIRLEAFHVDENNSDIMLVNILIREARPLQNTELMNKVYPLITEVLSLLGKKVSTKEDINELISIRTLDELSYGKVKRLSPPMLVTTFLMMDQNEQYFIHLRTEALYD
ncbi:MAG: hypothetical protein RR651_00965 [Lysinibacillus sp.]